MIKIFKNTKDYIIKSLVGDSVPQGLLELSDYFRTYAPIRFEHHKDEDGNITAVSTNFQYGSIITNGKDKEELEHNIKDAILTSFDVPAAYSKEAKLHRLGNKEGEYVFA